MEQLDLHIGTLEGGQFKTTASCSADSKPAVLPLAVKMRPVDLSEYVGQQHLLAPGKLLRRAIDADRFTSIILSGPPGTGKTTLAELIASSTNSEFVRLSGVTSTVADIRKQIKYAVERRKLVGRNTILFIDEIHRFNKAQQDSLLPDVENGNIRLVGATTHNPQFYVVGALLSRSLVFTLEALAPENIRTLLERAIADKRGLSSLQVEASDKALDFLAEACEGDARKALTSLEIAAMTTTPDDEGKVLVSETEAEESIQRKIINYGDDGHYDTASAFIKSMRGSDPDAAVYWMAKMLHAGEDIRFIARRIVIFASEDIGNADPRALTLAVSAMQGVEMIGMPEARIILSQAAVYCATAPKSNASYVAVDAALEDIRKERVQPVPGYLRDPNSSGAREKRAAGPDYKYPHDFEGGFTAQEYMGVPKVYYVPKDAGYEHKIKQRLEYWAKCRQSGVKE
ncbi:replication-associated recombination protein A [Lentisphaerota bacterium ZTH]|nr:replication-associated recombination protein A [Lentisphaerota bacterium]WET06771.1 replication-associated recombination protein A [Lentisphaerota bacterium ZTH]